MNFVGVPWRVRSLVLSVATGLALVSTGACRTNPDQQKLTYSASGDRYFAEGKYSEAIIEYRNAIQLDPRFAPAYLKLAAAQSRKGEIREALASYVRAADSEPGNIEIQLMAGDAFLLARQFDDARRRAETVLKLDPENVAALILQGSSLAGLGDPEHGILALEEAIRLDPSRSASYTNLALVAASQGRRDEAEAAFRKATEVDPSSGRTHLMLGNYLWAAGKISEAEAALRRSVQLSPRDALANRAVSGFYLSQGRQVEAEQYFKVAAAIDDVAKLALANYYLSTDRAQAALTEFQSFKNQTPEVTRGTVRALSALGQNSQAEALTDDLLKRQPSNPETLLLKGHLRLIAGKKDEAAVYLRKAADSDPNSAAAQIAVGRLLVAVGEIELAEKAFNRALAIDPNFTDAGLELSRVQLLKRNPDASLKYSEDTLARQPDNVEARIAVARSLLAAGEVSRAETAISSLVRTSPNRSGVATLQGAMAVVKKQPEVARTAFERAIQIEPTSIDALSGLVDLDLAERKYDDALARVEKQISAGKPRADRLVLGSRVALEKGDPVGAERFLRRAIDADPASLQAYVLLGQIYISQKRLDEARAEFEALAGRQSRPVAALTMAGMIAQVQGRTDAAQKLFERVLALEPRAVVAANNLAWIYAESGQRLDKAIELATQASAALPHSAEVLDTLGWAYYKKGRSAEAIAALTKSSEIEPKNPMYLYHLGMAHLQAGDIVSGRNALQRSLVLNPKFMGSENARRAIAETSVLLGTTDSRPK